MRINVTTVSGEIWTFKGEEAQKLETQLAANGPEVPYNVFMNNGGRVVLIGQHIESIYYLPVSDEDSE